MPVESERPVPCRLPIAPCCVCAELRVRRAVQEPGPNTALCCGHRGAAAAHATAPPTACALLPALLHTGGLQPGNGQRGDKHLRSNLIAIQCCPKGWKYNVPMGTAPSLTKCIALIGCVSQPALSGGSHYSRNAARAADARRPPASPPTPGLGLLLRARKSLRYWHMMGGQRLQPVGQAASLSVQGACSAFGGLLGAA